jgi:TolB protein
LRLEDGTRQDITQYASQQPPSSLERVYDSIWAFYPAFSPDGSMVAFASQYGPPYGSPATDYRLTLFEMTPAPNSERSQIFSDEHANVGRIAYMPDGNAILFTYTPDSPEVSSIYRYDIAAGTAERLPGVPDQSYDPAPSPDGRWLAFAARTDGRTDVYLMPMSGGEPVRVTTSGLARAPAFSPDGTRLAFIGIGEGERGFDLWVLDLDPATGQPAADGQPRRLTTDMNLDADSGLSWGV